MERYGGGGKQDIQDHTLVQTPPYKTSAQKEIHLGLYINPSIAFDIPIDSSHKCSRT